MLREFSFCDYEPVARSGRSHSRWTIRRTGYCRAGARLDPRTSWNQDAGWI